MAFKQGNNPLSRKASPMRMSPFKKEEPSMSMDELQKMSAAQDAASKAQAQQLPQLSQFMINDFAVNLSLIHI